MAKKENRVMVVLACQECKRRNYNTQKNKQSNTDRLELSKYCRFCRCHRAHRETKYQTLRAGGRTPQGLFAGAEWSAFVAGKEPRSEVYPQGT